MSTSTNELWLGYGNDVLSFGNEIVSCDIPVPKSIELVNFGSTEYKQSTKGSNEQYVDLSSGASYPYMTISCGINIYYYNNTDSEDWMLGDDTYQENKWRMRGPVGNDNVGFVGIKSDKGVLDWTDAPGITTTSTTRDNWTYRRIPEWLIDSGYKYVKLVYDVENYRCYVYIEGSLYGYATIDYSPYTITRISVQKEQTYGNNNFAAYKDFKIGAFQNLQDAINY